MLPWRSASCLRAAAGACMALGASACKPRRTSPLTRGAACSAMPTDQDRIRRGPCCNDSGRAIPVWRWSVCDRRACPGRQVRWRGVCVLCGLAAGVLWKQHSSEVCASCTTVYVLLAQVMHATLCRNSPRACSLAEPRGAGDPPGATCSQAGLGSTLMQASIMRHNTKLLQHPLIHTCMLCAITQEPYSHSPESNA